MALQKTLLWVIKNLKGSLVGPCTTDTVLKLIHSGELTGEELICSYPNGAWIPIGKETIFYEALVKELEMGQLSTEQREKIKKQEDETIISSHQDKTKTSTEAGHSQVDTKDFNLPTEINSKITNINKSGTKTQSVKKKKSFISIFNEQSEERKKMILTLAIFTGVVLIAMFFLVGESESNGNKLRLILPNISKKTNMSDADRINLSKKAFDSYQADSQSDYVEAEKSLIKLVEAFPQNIKFRSLLCLVYKELWPFAVQDSTDFKTIQIITQSTKSLDPVGLDGVLCEITKLIANGKSKEAKSVVDNALNDPNQSGSPYLYELKGELLQEESDFYSANAYLEKAEQLWPSWIKPKIESARVLRKIRKLNEAQIKYQNILKIKPQHKSALIELGILEYQEYNLLDSAYARIYEATKSTEPIKSRLEAQAYYVLAMILSDKKEKASAIKFAEKAYEINSSDEKIKELLVRLGREKVLKNSKNSNSETLFMGEQYFRNGDYLSAQAEFRAAFEADPKNSLAAMKAAKSLWALYLPLDAINYLKKAIAADPENITAYYSLADYYSQRFDFNEAIKTLNLAASKGSNNYEILRGYSLVELRRNNFPAAISFGERANKVYENDIETLNIISQAHLKKDDFKKSYQFALRAIELDPTHIESQIIYSQILSQFQGFETGVTYLKELINKYAYTYDYRIALAKTLETEQRYDKSFEIYEQVNALTNYKNKAAMLGSGDCLKNMGKTEEALSRYLKAAIIDPFDPKALFSAGLVYMETARYKEAIKQFERVSKSNPLYPRVNYNIGRVAFEMGDLDLALKSAQEEKKYNPSLADSYILAAETYAANKQFLKCTSEYQQALKLRPQGADIYVKLASCYRRTGNLDVAEAMLSVATSKESGYPEIYKEYGVYYEQRGDKRSAAQSYQKYLSLSPNARDKDEVNSKIQLLGY